MSQEKLEIKNLSLLKITKVKDWAIYFDYDDAKYLLHTSSEDCETSTTLFRRKSLNNFGKYELEYICSSYGNNIPYLTYFHDKRRIKNYKSRPLKEINRNKFIWDLTWNDYFSGEYSKGVEENKTQINNIENTIKVLRETINLLRKDIKINH